MDGSPINAMQSIVTSAPIFDSRSLPARLAGYPAAFVHCEFIK